MDDKKICDGLRMGDKKILDELYSRYHEKIFRFAFSYLKSEDDAFDIIQDVFIKIWLNRQTIKKETCLNSLVFAYAKNTIISVFRKKVTEKKYLDYLCKSATSNNLGAVELSDYSFIIQQYNELIKELPTRRKQIFILSRLKGLRNKEIAEQLGLSEKTVENQITKALAFFNLKLES